jgi:hypothetical protein
MPHDLSHVREALEAAKAMVEREIAKPCNHHIGDALAVKRIIMKGLAELNEQHDG